MTGSQLVLDGRSWLVTGREEHGYAVEGVDDSECMTLKFDRVDQAIKDRDCEVIKPKDAEKRDMLLRYTGGIELMEQLSEEQQNTIRFRLAIVLAIDALEAEGYKITQRNISKGGEYRSLLLRRAATFHKEENYSGPTRGGRVKLVFTVPEGRTLKEYQATFHEYGENPIVLMDRDHMKGNRTRRMSACQEAYIEHVVSLWQDKRKPKLAPIMRLVEAEFHVPPHERASGFKFPSITTIRAWIKALSAVALEIGRNGIRHARNRKNAGSTDIRALSYGENVQVDQVYLSIFTNTDGTVEAKRIDPKKVSEDLEKDEIRRLWLHVMIDIATRLPLAWIISKTADADHTEALLRMATRDKIREKIRYGCKKDPAPAVRIRKFEADNGTATRAAVIYGRQLGAGMTIIPGRTYHASDKPHVETLFGTMQWQVLNFLPGYTGSRPGELKDYDPKGSTEVTHDEIYGTLTRYFVDEYAHTAHRGTGMFSATPWEKYQEVRETYRTIEPPSQKERCLHLGVKTEVSTTPEGVKVFNIPFNSTELQKFAGGCSRKVTVHLDPDDLRTAYVTAVGRSGEIEVNLSMTAFSDLTLEEAISLMEEACSRDPKAAELHDAHLRDVRRSRARSSGYFPDTRDPSNYQTIDQLRRRADGLAQVSVRPYSETGPTARPGYVTDREDGAPVFKVSDTTAPPTSTSRKSQPAGMSFKPIKKSKL
ncbi:transposase family protein [Lentibacter sp. XHP0401]|uniref:transposase family protein n=1 Tax=Lentibacter sp. XHP0401 TaxID=2984334 RepID=UPI0021E7A9AE|nr:transposase family protein [Lentibacter sp. XHP0401]MCV2893729.1 transposase family protein [Lentibacter sp. XHP0401]